MSAIPGQYDGPLPRWVRLAEQRADANTLLRVFEVEYPPIDVEAIAGRMDISIESETAEGVSGRVDVDREKMTAIIRVRRDHVPWRQRFTVAHEIGHLLLGHADSTTCFRAFAGSPEEAAANRFAADLLMPLWMLEPLTLKHGADARTLARIFGVSEEAMNIRLGVLTGIRH